MGYQVITKSLVMRILHLEKPGVCVCVCVRQPEEETGGGCIQKS